MTQEKKMIKVSELKDERLDYWVAKAEGLKMKPDSAAIYRPKECRGAGVVVHGGAIVGTDYSPSTDWSQGGPIIQRNFIELAWNGDPSECKASWMHNNGVYSWQFGPDALTAAMRCFVASKFGEEVDDSQAHHI